MLIIDSNMWAYYFDKDAPEHPFVADRIDKALSSEKIVMNTVIIIEVAHFLVRSLGPVIGKDKMETFLSYPFTIVDLDYDLTQEAIDILVAYYHTGIGGRDATILATMKHLDFNKIMTHDESFRRVEWIEVIDPILRG
ncbi:type II toxin-antitoxin system VapC family toxin [Candidatus Bathyarchaeota archaeon]|nr:type II toxin-antitoxin system VapC family toxin [Candidatus Bathyarchaeota archaeon]